MCRLYGKFASYLRRVLSKKRLIFPRINGPIKIVLTVRAGSPSSWGGGGCWGGVGDPHAHILKRKDRSVREKLENFVPTISSQNMIEN